MHILSEKLRVSKLPNNVVFYHICFCDFDISIDEVGEVGEVKVKLVFVLLIPFIAIGGDDFLVVD